MGNFGSEKTFRSVYLMHFPTESMSELLRCTCKILCMKNQICCIDIFQCIFFSQSQVTVDISGSVTIHLLVINNESAEFQLNSTGLQLVSGADIRFEQIKTTYDLRICWRDILEVGDKDHDVLFFIV